MKLKEHYAMFKMTIVYLLWMSIFTCFLTPL